MPIRSIAIFILMLAVLTACSRATLGPVSPMTPTPSIAATPTTGLASVSPTRTVKPEPTAPVELVGEISVSDDPEDLMGGLASVSPTRTVKPEPTAPVEFVWKISVSDDPNDLIGGLAIDPQGNLLVTDLSHSQILTFDPNGQLLRRWGSQGSGEGQFNFDRGGGDLIGSVAVDTQGNIYVTDAGNDRVQKFDPTGVFQITWGSQGQGDGQFEDPFGVAVDSLGYVYVIDDYRDDVQKFTPTGQFLTRWGGHGSRDGELNYAGGMTIDAHDQVYVADQANHRVQKFSRDGQFLTKWGGYGSAKGEFIDPVGIATDPSGAVFVVEFAERTPRNWRIQKFDSQGTFLFMWGTPGKRDGEFYYPASVTADANGAIYVADYGNNRIQKFRHR